MSLPAIIPPENTIETIKRWARQRRELLRDNQRLLREKAALERSAKAWWIWSLVTMTVCMSIVVVGLAVATVWRDQVDYRLTELETRRVQPERAQFVRAIADLRRRARDLDSTPNNR